MKKLIVILSCLLVLAFHFSQTLKADESSWDSERTRSFTLFLSIEENELHIYSEKQWDNIHIQIQDINGIIDTLSPILLPAGEETVIPLGKELSAGNYQVSLIRNGFPINWYITIK